MDSIKLEQPCMYDSVKIIYVLYHSVIHYCKKKEVTCNNNNNNKM